VDERIEKGLRAYEIAEQVGWARCEAALCRYGVLPSNFLDAAEALFTATHQRLMTLTPTTETGCSSLPACT
jgi:hypothetical protein